jgi:hypothetical protein
MTTGHVKACSFPSGVRSLTLCSRFCVCGGRRQCGPPAGPAPPSERDCAPSGSGGAELPFLGSSEARRDPLPRGRTSETCALGSGEPEPVPWGSDEVMVTPFNRSFDFNCWGPLIPLLLGTLKLVPDTYADVSSWELPLPLPCAAALYKSFFCCSG